MLKTKRIVSLLLCLAMLLSLLPASVVAAEPKAGATVIDFTDEDATSGYIKEKTTDSSYTADGLALKATQHAFEPCGGWSEGAMTYPSNFTEDQATNPTDVVEIPVSGENWTATLAFDFESTGDNTAGYYAFFGMYAMEGDGYQTGVGIRGGDGCFQDWERHDGTLTTDTDKRAPATASGFKAANGSNYWFRIVRDGDSYTAYWSMDGETFTEENSIAYDATGINADKLVIDAYSGMGNGFVFTLKTLTIEGGAATTSTVIDFASEADAGKYEIDQQTTDSSVSERGLHMRSTMHAFEPCIGVDGNTGEESNPNLSEDVANNPADVVKVPVGSGDWTATLTFDYDLSNAQNGYYQFFGFYAMADYGNGLGIRAGDGKTQDFYRVDGGRPDADTDKSAGLEGLTRGNTATSGSCTYQIVKEGSNYTCYFAFGDDELQQMFTYEDVPFAPAYLVMDAYTGMTEGYEFWLKNLTIEGAASSTDLRSINFLDASSARKYSIEDQESAEIVDGQPLRLVSTNNCPEGNDGENTTEIVDPKDWLKIPVADGEGDWTATLKFGFDAGASPGYYEFFGFYACDDCTQDAWNNFAGIRGADGTMQATQIVNGTPTTHVANDVKGLKENGSTFWFRLEKKDGNYTTYSSIDGENFSQVSTHDETGISGNTIVIDAYSAMSTGYTYDLEYLYFGDDNDAMNQYGVDNAVKALAKQIPAEIELTAAGTYQLPSLSGYTITYTTDAGEVDASGKLSASVAGPIELNITVAGPMGKTASKTVKTTLVSGGPVSDETPIYEDSTGEYSFDERAADLVARMTVAQKGSQLSGSPASAIAAEDLGTGALNTVATKSIARYDWWSEALHGYSRDTNGNSNNSTSYPQNITAGSTWNTDLYYQEGLEIGKEIRERSTNHAMNLNFYSPTINLQRDPRWGRNEETFSEDVLLNGLMGSAFVKGMEGKNPDGTMINEDGYYQTHATIKHYVANNSEDNRLRGGTSNADVRMLYEYYSAPYREVIQNAGVSSVMTAYSTYEGDPCSYSSFLMDTLLRQTFGLKGFITSDCDSVATLSRLNYTNPYTGNALTTLEKFAGAMAHGEDLECNGGWDSNQGGNSYASLAQTMIDEAVPNDTGVFTENTMDIALQRLMSARIATGEFDDVNQLAVEAQERVDAQDSSAELKWQTPERLKLAEDIAKEGVVMLKNDDILPLTKESGNNIVLVGDWQTNMHLGLYSSGQSNGANHVNMQKGITDAINRMNPDAKVTYITTNNLTAADEQTIRDADVAIVVVGTISQSYTAGSYCSEDNDRDTIALPNGLDTFIAQVGDLNENTIAVIETCGSIQVNTYVDKIKGLLWTGFGGIRKGVGVGAVIAGEVNPSGHTTSTWYRSDADIPNILDYNLYPTETTHGRTYMYYDNPEGVSYPFGYGLSYTTFEYSDLSIDKTDYTADDTVKITFTVTNTGDVAGKDVAQVYIGQPDVDKSLNRPIRRLVGFEKVDLEPGESTTVTIEASIPDLAYFNADEDVMAYQVDEGKYQVQVGEDSAHADLTADFNVSGEMSVYPAVLNIKPHAVGDTEQGIEQRLIYSKGQEVEPQVTVSMNDASLHGYVIAHQTSKVRQVESSELPAGMTVTYESNRPEVVKVEDGKILTVGPGVATITATATYNGHSATDDFVVYVESTASLSSITVNDEPLEGFSPDKNNYELSAADYTAVPRVWYVANAELQVTVQQAESLPGVATITATNPETGESAVYRIGFGAEPETVDFSAGTEGLTVLNANAANAATGADGLTITAGTAGFDGENVPQNVYVEPAIGSWVAQTHLTLDAALTGTQEAGMLVYDEASNVIRVGYTADGVLKASNGASATIADAPTDLYLQMVKQGSTYSINYSVDGTTWTALTSGIENEMALPQVGVYAYGDTAFDATFDGINIGDVGELYPRLSGISVNGAPLDAFNSETFEYNIAVDDDASEAPVVTATAAEGYDVQVQSIDTATGIVEITVASSSASQLYRIAFNHRLMDSDYFADGDYNTEKWSIENPDDSAYSVETGKGLVMPTQSGDIYNNGKAWKNAFTTPALGTWEVVVKAFYPTPLDQNYQQGMVLIWEDDDNYIRLNCQDSRHVLEPGIESNGSFTSGAGYDTSKNATVADDNTITLYFKINSTGSSFNLAYSQDGMEFTDLGTVDNINYFNPKLVLFATQNSNAEQQEMYFEYLYVTEREGVHGAGYDAMLQWAAQNVADYVAADLPDETAEDLTLAAVPHGYELTVTSDNADVIANDGKVTPAEEDTQVNLTVTIAGADGNVTATATKQVTVSGTGIVPPEPEKPDTKALEKAIADAEALKAEDYMDEGYKAVTEALAAAKDALKADTQAAVDAATKALTDAIAALKQAPKFEDVTDPNTFYYDAVYWAARKEITNGKTETTFVPQGDVKRGEVVTFLYRAMGEPEVKNTTNPFTDVDINRYYGKAVLWAVENGITKGVSETTFCPERTCTRAEFVTFLHRALGEPKAKETKHNFTDLNENAYYMNAVLWAVENGVTTGVTATTFVPARTCNRGQCVTFLHRALEDQLG